MPLARKLFMQIIATYATLVSILQGIMGMWTLPWTSICATSRVRIWHLPGETAINKWRGRAGVGTALFVGGIGMTLVGPQVIRHFIDTAQVQGGLSRLYAAALLFLVVGVADRLLGTPDFLRGHGPGVEGDEPTALRPVAPSPQVAAGLSQFAYAAS